MPMRLRVTDHPAACWSGVVEPWLRAYGTNWQETRTILAPNAFWIAALKAAAVETGLAVMGVEWCTPGHWRAKALSAFPGRPPRVALREDLHLLLELAATSLPENPLARAYGQDPAPFQQLLDTLEGAGWETAALEDASCRELAQAAAKLRTAAGWATSAEVDRQLRDMAATGKLPRLGQRLLAVGFGPGDWPLRSLLEAACSAYDDVDLSLDVTDAAQPPAAAWVGSWEEFSKKTAEWLEPDGGAAPFKAFADEMQDSAAAKANGARAQLWLARDLQEEADAVAMQALRFLQEPGGNSPRIGIVVGSVNSPLAREVAARLVSLGLPHHDVPGHLPGRSTEQALFEAWLDWQERARLPDLVDWMRAANLGGLIDDDFVRTVETSLKAAVGATLSDDPAVISGWLAGGGHAGAQEFIAAWPVLPASASLAAYIEALTAVAEKLGWPAPPEMLALRTREWTGEFSAAIPRRAILRWVRAVTRVPGRTRDALGREPFAPLRIIDAASAAAQNWTHLILGGLQHGEWPAADVDSPLLPEERIQALNRQVLRQGSQGEGHWTVVPGRGLLLSQADRRRLDRAAFLRLAGLPTCGLALTSRRADPADGRPGRLSEYFWLAARSMLGRLPSEADWSALENASCAESEMFRRLLSSESAVPAKGHALPVAQTAKAYSARRDSATAFDEYSFCLRRPPPSPLRLSCKDWEAAVDTPGAAWFAKLLRTEPQWDPATEDCVRLSAGTWAHQFVRAGPAADISFPVPGSELWLQMASAQAKELHTQVAAACAKAGQPLSESWLETWALAARVARQWIAALGNLPAWPHALAEVRLPRDLTGKLPGAEVALPLAGRMDLVLWAGATNFSAGKLNGAKAWVLDFKSGQDKPLSVKKLAQGEGLQLALYALALLSLGAEGADLTLLTRDGEAVPQLSNEDLLRDELLPLWRLLADFSTAGRWGERRDLADRFANAGNYPSATLPVPADILSRKWALSHEFPA